MSARHDFPGLASIADTGLVIAGLRRECLYALVEIDHLRTQNEHLVVMNEMKDKR